MTASLERVYDQPGGADRLVARSTGVTHLWANGVATRYDGADVAGAAAGQVLRS
jgi:N-acyl-D-amino-acid deacylase